MAEEKIIEDVSEVEDTGLMEVYVRFNDDEEKDYCFQVKVSSTFSDLNRIFNQLPISLRPSIFFNSRPVGYAVLTSPGYLTEDGALLFSYEVSKDKFRKKVAPSDKISDKVWPGQLIVPIWEFNYFGFYSFVLFLLFWLYTDLPDAISPTPGICLTNQVSKVVGKLLRTFDQPRIAAVFLDDLHTETPLMPQIIFFIFHCIKCLVILTALYIGMFNPIRLFKFGNKPPADISKEQLVEIGWTGARRATPEEYKDFYREYKIKQFGGMIPAHEAGLFKKLENLGVFLGNGEGFDTPLEDKSTLKDLLDEDNEKFTLNYQYLAKLGQFFESYTADNDSNMIEAIKQFRRYGILHSDEVISKIVANRKKRGDSKIVTTK